MAFISQNLKVVDRNNQKYIVQLKNVTNMLTAVGRCSRKQLQYYELSFCSQHLCNLYDQSINPILIQFLSPETGVAGFTPL